LTLSNSYFSNLQAVLFLLAVIVRAANSPDYDSDDEYINPRQSAKQPLISRQSQPTVVPVTGALDQRPSRNDAWSARMREKVLLMLFSF